MLFYIDSILVLSFFLSDRGFSSGRGKCEDEGRRYGKELRCYMHVYRYEMREKRMG